MIVYPAVKLLIISYLKTDRDQPLSIFYYKAIFAALK